MSRDTDAVVVQSLARGLATIEAFSSERPSLTISQAAEVTGLSRPTARRVLLTLEALGYAQKSGNEFRLTPKTLNLGYGYISSMGVGDIAQSEMERLTELTDESCSVGALDGMEVVYIARVPTRRIMSISIGLGTRLPATATSMGRVLLGGLPDDELEQRLSRFVPEKYTSRTIDDRERLLNEIRLVRERGWALVDQELEDGLRSIAAPILSAEGDVVAAMNLGTSAARVSVDDLKDRLLPLLLEAANRVSDHLRRGQLRRTPIGG
jgi:IclR family transcriptional regulator, pca regulon regulatory protein